MRPRSTPLLIAFALLDRVEVAWPSGRKQVVTRGLRADDTVRITEPR